MALALDIEETSQMILRQPFGPIGVNGNELVLLSDTYLVARNSMPGACLFQVFGYFWIREIHVHFLHSDFNGVAEIL